MAKTSDVDRAPVHAIVMRLRDGNRVADEQTRRELREAADEIERLWKCLLRADPVCEHMHHDKHEYHTTGPCPVEAWVREGFDA